jgi:dTMP kinase
MSKGFVIAVDGPDGVGKTTQIQLLKEWFETRGSIVYLTRMSGGSPIGEKLRNVSLSDTPRPGETDFYISLAMIEAALPEIRRHKNEGHIVLIDRSPLAWLAYNAYGSQMDDKSPVEEAIAAYVDKIGMDLLFYLDAPEEALQKRIRTRTDKPTDYFEKQPETYRKRVGKGYEHGLALLRKNAVTTRIDAQKDIQTIQNQIRDALQTQVL